MFHVLKICRFFEICCSQWFKYVSSCPTCCFWQNIKLSSLLNIKSLCLKVLFIWIFYNISSLFLPIVTKTTCLRIGCIKNIKKLITKTYFNFVLQACTSEQWWSNTVLPKIWVWNNWNKETVLQAHWTGWCSCFTKNTSTKKQVN